MQISNDVRQHGVHTHRFHRRRAVAALLFALGLCLGIPGASEAIGPFTNLGITGGTAQHREFAAPEDLVITSLGVLARTNTLDAPGDVVITHNGVDTPLRLTYPPRCHGPADRAVEHPCTGGGDLRLPNRRQRGDDGRCTSDNRHLQPASERVRRSGSVSRRPAPPGSGDRRTRLVSAPLHGLTGADSAAAGHATSAKRSRTAGRRRRGSSPPSRGRTLRASS